jgi:CBS domain-containing protein
MRVGDICNQQAVIIGKTDSVYTAAVLMRDYHVNYIVVVESRSGHNVPVGSLTDRDIVVDMVANNADLATLTIGEVMKPSLLLASENDNVVATLRRMRYKSLQHIPVINEHKELIGVLSIDGILDMLAEELNDISHIINRVQLLSQESSSVKY